MSRTMFGLKALSRTYRGYLRRCHPEKVEVVIHSSSHLGPHRGVVEGVKRALADDFNVHVVARGGRKWDDGLMKDFHEINKSKEGKPVLHIILLGDNDLRGTKMTDSVNPFIKKFGQSVKKHKDNESKYNVFVNGLLPFPMHGRADSNELIENYFRYTREMYGLTKCSPEIYYVPMRDSMMEFCRLEKVTADRLFRRDKVHLTSLGEEFLIRHLVYQARMYKAALGNCVLADDLVFFRNVASAHRTRLENLRIMMKEYRVTSVLTKNF